jgi:hypothetical protein
MAKASLSRVDMLIKCVETAHTNVSTSTALLQQVELPKPDGSTTAAAAAGGLPRRGSKATRLGEDEETVVVDVTRLHRCALPDAEQQGYCSPMH